MDTHHYHTNDTHTIYSGMGVDCNGLPNRHGGTWQGHVIPGALFIVWGSWWAYNACIRYIWRRPQQPFTSKSFYSLNFAIRYLEPWLKVILPPIAISVELYFDHTDGYQYLYCPPETKYAGRFAAENYNNWQHASSYPAIFLSGIIDLLSTHGIDMPPGTPHAALATAFAIMSFLMGTHQKHEAQDRAVHWLLFISMLMCTIFILLELHAPKNPLPSFGKAASTLLLGAWMIQIAVAEFENHPEWSTEYDGGTIMAPTFFSMIFVFIMACMASLYILLYFVHSLLHSIPASWLIALDDDVSIGFRGMTKETINHAYLDGSIPSNVEMMERRNLVGAGLSFENDSPVVGGEQERCNADDGLYNHEHVV